MRLDWNKLLCDKRLRNLLEGTEMTSYTDVMPDSRSNFDRDYDRVVFATPVRRLQDKTQVFPLDAVDSVRTRLTHSMEVSSIARNLAVDAARRLSKIDNSLPAHAERAFEAICGACGLLHDIGNPPFGHPGEEAIISWIKESGLVEKIGDSDSTGKIGQPQIKQQKDDYSHFNGNAQTFRLITKLQVLADFYGLNLTAATLATSLKYTANSVTINDAKHETSKLGFFASEQEVAEKVWEATGLHPGQRHPLAHIVEAADDIAYSAVDIEDAVRKGVIEWEDFRKYISDTAGAKVQKSFEYVEKYFAATADRQKLGARNLGEAKVQIFRTATILRHADCFQKTFTKRYDAIMNGSYHGEITCDELFQSEGYIKELKEYAKNHIWHSKPNIRLEILGNNAIKSLLDIFKEAKCEEDSVGRLDLNGHYGTRIYSLMSSNYRRVYERCRGGDKLDPRYARLQLIVDYVCGMTDSFAVNTANELASIGRLK